MARLTGGAQPRNAAIGLGLGMFAGTAALLLFSIPAKLVAVFLAGCAGLAGALLSGNLRLFCLWGLLLTLPFDLAKRFGTVLYKMGGETAFKIEVSDPFLLALLFFLGRDLWRRQRPGLRIPKVTFVWMAIMLLGLIPMLLGPWRLSAAHEIFRMIKVMLLFLVIANEVERPSRVLHCVSALTLSVMFQATIGVYQYATRSHLGLELLGETGSGTIDQLMSDSVRSASAFRAGAFLSHPNIFGIFLACLLPLAVALFLLGKDTLRKPFFLATVALGMGALIATLSRSGWLSFFMAFVVLLLLMLMHHRLQARTMVAAIGTALALGAVCVILAAPIAERVFKSKTSAMRSRAEYRRTAVKMIRARPVLGWGLNGYTYSATPFTKYGARGAREKFQGTEEHPGWWLPPVHNIFMLWWAETGVVGLFLHITLLAMILRTALRNMRVQNELLYAVNAACIAAMAAFMVDGFFSFSLRINSILRIFWVLAGLVMSIHYWRLRQRAADFSPAAAVGSPEAQPG